MSQTKKIIVSSQQKLCKVAERERGRERELNKTQKTKVFALTRTFQYADTHGKCE